MNIQTALVGSEECGRRTLTKGCGKMADDKKKKSTQVGAGLALGVGVGLAVGNAVGNVEAGLAIGIAIGLGGGVCTGTR